MADPVDELYTLPPSAFTAARNALAKALRAEKRRDEAEAVKSLRRPAVPAWALNQVARAHPEAIERVLEAGAAVATAQRRALSGVRSAGLRDAAAQRRAAIDDAFDLAAGVLRDAGAQPQTHRMAIAATLEAATADPDVAEVLRAGRLTTDLPAPTGFGDVSGFSLVPADGEDADDAPHAEDVAVETASTADRRRAAQNAAAAARAQAEQARRRADDLADRAADARRQAVRTEAEAQRLEERAARVRERAKQAATEADDLAADAQAAAAAADQAEADAGAAEDQAGQGT